MNPKVEKLINKTAKENGWDPTMVKAVVDTTYRLANELMNDYRYPRIQIPSLGAFVPRATKVEDEIAKLLLKLKSHRNPNFLNDKIKTLVLTSKRIRNERIARRHSTPDSMVESAKQRVREAGRIQRGRRK